MSKRPAMSGTRNSLYYGSILTRSPISMMFAVILIGIVIHKADSKKVVRYDLKGMTNVLYFTTRK